MTIKFLARVGLAFLLALPLAALAQSEESPPRPDRNPHRAHAGGPQETLLPSDAPTVAWSEREVAAAKAACAKLLEGVALDYEALPPLKEGLCGAPAPIRIKAIGSAPRVEIDPPATVTCSLARALSIWLDKTVQPDARAALGVPVVKLNNASSYVCRNRYNGTDTSLSEHALANALDISEFVLQSGERVTVLANWPRVVAVVSVPPLPLPNPVRVSASPEITGVIARASRRRAKTVEAIDVAKPTMTDARANPFVVPTVAPKAPPPRTPAEATPPEMQSLAERKSAFLRNVHDEACKSFGTVLGPEANDVHKNHFHLDMKARRHTGLCE